MCPRGLQQPEVPLDGHGWLGAGLVTHATSMDPAPGCGISCAGDAAAGAVVRAVQKRCTHHGSGASGHPLTVNVGDAPVNGVIFPSRFFASPWCTIR
ncbi:hypothetical protein GCM10010298_47140 [Streptomyces microflavus]|uniref:Uncharacterized protein n=1 Tax=Streptomyces microflavus TaxID=1919 RepID=A0A7J0CJD0_STRMI|nr:hypothetical protein Smic_03930 [Streptomyces microflavus]GGX76616.1 hypothetical protein GCM10010298_47140 [Streptomyces microflavus]